MGDANWYRKTTWTPFDREEFFAHLKRSRLESRGRYLRIQALCLQQVGSPRMLEAALELLAVMFADYPLQAELASAYLQKAQCFDALGTLGPAEHAFRSALEEMRAQPEWPTDAHLAFAMFAVTRRIERLYGEALAALEEFTSEQDLWIPAVRYRYAAAKAIILAHSGRMAEASRHAQEALGAASQKHSGFWRQPRFGLVQRTEPGVQAELERLAAQEQRPTPTVSAWQWPGGQVLRVSATVRYGPEKGPIHRAAQWLAGVLAPSGAPPDAHQPSRRLESHRRRWAAVGLKQFEELTEADLADCPVWVSCHVLDHDEPWYRATDEATFRPWRQRLPVDPSQATFLVRARFTLADGSGLSGFITPMPPQAPAGEAGLGNVQPHVFLPSQGAFGFWRGMRRLTAEERAGFYGALGKAAREVFPAVFEAEAGLALGTLVGQVRGFYWIERFPNVEIEV